MNFFFLDGISESNFKKWTEKWTEKIKAIESPPPGLSGAAGHPGVQPQVPERSGHLAGGVEGGGRGGAGRPLGGNFVNRDETSKTHWAFLTLVF